MASMVAESAVAKKPQRLDMFFKTELCKFFPNCSKGEACPYAHTRIELQARPDLYKTTLCWAWRRNQCPLNSAECKFAHGSRDLCLPVSRPRPEAPDTVEPDPDCHLPPAPAAPKIRRRRRMQHTKPCGGAAAEEGTTSGRPWQDEGECFARRDSDSGAESDSNAMTPTMPASAGWSPWGPQAAASRASSKDSDNNETPNYMGVLSSLACQEPSVPGRPACWAQQKVPSLPGHAGADTRRQELPVPDLHEGHDRQSPFTAALKIPMLHDTGTQKVAVLVSLVHSDPEDVWRSRAAIEKALRAAAPTHYED